jgi:hypothetical protein
MPQDLAQRLPPIICVEGDGAPSVVAPTGISTMRGSGGSSISHALSFSYVDGVIEQEGGYELQ